MLTRLIDTVARIKSPQLYQLSYRPKLLQLLGKARARLGSFGAVVPAVYPRHASMSSTPPFAEEDMGDLWRRAVSG